MDSIVSPLAGCCAWGGVCRPCWGCGCSGAVGTVSKGFCVFCCCGGLVCCAGAPEGAFCAGGLAGGGAGCGGAACCPSSALPSSARHTRSGGRPCSLKDFVKMIPFPP